jgi:predicted nucleic acid-binding protein
VTPHAVLDTDVVSRIHKGTLPPALVRQLTGYATCVTFVTIAELKQ